MVLDFDIDVRSALILERPFMNTDCALVDVSEGRSSLLIGDESVYFNMFKVIKQHDNDNDA